MGVIALRLSRLVARVGSAACVLFFCLWWRRRLWRDHRRVDRGRPRAGRDSAWRGRRSRVVHRRADELDWLCHVALSRYLGTLSSERGYAYVLSRLLKAMGPLTERSRVDFALVGGLRCRTGPCVFRSLGLTPADLDRLW